MSFSIGDTVDTYRILEELGQGGMGRVFKVEHALTRRLEAMKVLSGGLAGAPEQASRSLREIQVQARLDHPNIASVHNAFYVGDDLVLVMELIEGCSLRRLLESGRVPLATAIDYACQALSALSYAHAHGVIHRDVSPANMMVTPKGVLKLTDFGLSKGPTDVQLSQPGAPIGSLYYMSPEQVRGATPVGPPSDIYALGAVLYELVTGQRPFDGDGAFSVMVAHVQKPPVPPIEIEPSLPELLNHAILQALAKDSSERFLSADDFREALLQISPQEIAAASPRSVFRPASIALPKSFAIPKLALPKLGLPKFDLPKFNLPKLDLPRVDLTRARIAGAAAALVVLTAGVAEFRRNQAKHTPEPTPAPVVVNQPQPLQPQVEDLKPENPQASAPQPAALASSTEAKRPSQHATAKRSGNKHVVAHDIGTELVSAPIANSNIAIQPVEEHPASTEFVEPPPLPVLHEEHVNVQLPEVLTHSPAIGEGDATSKTAPAVVKKGLGRIWRLMRLKKGSEAGASTVPPDHP